MSALDPRPGDLWLLLRSRPGADPQSEVVRLRRLIKLLGRLGFKAWWVDAPPAGAAVREEAREDAGDGP